MKLLHTIEEIRNLEQQMSLAHELLELNNKYNNDVIKNEANRIIDFNNSELEKYNHLIGITAYCPPSSLDKNKSYRKGIIERISHFNSYSKSVRVSFRYDKSIGGGFDGHSLLELKETI